jgi:exopolysaccharide biosynthesis polyprenyl glycosylphosphotransferase
MTETALLGQGAAGATEERGRRSGRRGYLMRRALLVADLVGLTFAFVAATQLFPAPHTTDRLGPSIERLIFVATLPAWVVLARLHGLYDGDEERADHSTADDLVGVFHLVTIGTFMVMLAGWLTGRFNPTPPKLFTFWILAVLAVTFCRALARGVVRRARGYVQRTVIVGAGPTGRRIAAKVAQHREYGIEIAGFVDGTSSGSVDGLPVLGDIDDLCAVVRAHEIDRVIVAFSGHQHDRVIRTLRELALGDVQIDVVPRFFEAVGPNVKMHTVEGLPLAALPRLRMSRSSRLLKRALDVVVAAVASVLMLPVGVLIALAIKLDSRGPVFFRQVRVGEEGRLFRICKFRTMVCDAEEQKAALAGLNKHALRGVDDRMFKIPSDPRVTRVGKLLRRWSLDEIPQVLNVLTGDMSLVGPRPLIPEESEHVVDWRRRRLNVKPGITGLWQVLGRDDIPFEEMTALDYQYVTGWSLVGDLQLMIRTLPAVARSRSSY